MTQSEMDSTSKSIIYKDLRKAIITGEYPPGEQFNVEEIARRYSTSVTPVRDALQMLSHEDLVTIRPRSGYFVSRITLKHLRDLLELRRILEVAAVERAALRITDEQLLQLRTIHSGFTGEDEASSDRYLEENRRFHVLLAVASGNQELADQVGRIHDRLARFMMMRRAGKSQEIIHKRILDALQANNMDTARQALLDDIDTTRDTILDKVMLEEAGSWPLDL